METDQVLAAPPSPVAGVRSTEAAAPPPEPRTEPAEASRQPDPLKGIRVAPEHPANELSVRRWLSDDVQWVQDEIGIVSELGLSRSRAVIGHPGRTPGETPPLTVNGTLETAGLDVSGPQVQMTGLPPRESAPIPARLRTLLVDPETGQIYID